jgi:ADP-ribosylation factor-like protein 2
VWVVDCADTRRLGDCKAEFEKLLQQERLAGSSLLVFANKQVRPNHLPPPVARALMRRRICPAR